ncbi:MULTISPECIES: chromosome partitioning protein ParA [Vibrio]|uniref:chromosome partitioning protein ParA n=1 Tax=Vibrio TaxID=662 RepID=UPI000C172271|nr:MULTISPECIES: chromosome partitioning protein ParA [Vibrio]NAW69429.1 chromosome partitioning protein ParA [Vibrio sp. V28_P6S34P95]NAX05798.1 chromosome partitioning protein ParA [Vibrio sp. V30_P3S12P165]NAX34149.1 chromosome partitioning protein ParA [Vibrio sp. V29_P1S30P107]NAX38426.1 chromosome partitioning protein ParA [Vibrio sp. V27_P1S3P104]NAX40822.1 chromosome partitioning protein ParA [Vibrio sp. V26_P1S5P106]
MVAINGLPPARISNTQQTSKAKKNDGAKGQSRVSQTSKVADAVSHSIRQVDLADIDRARLHYDLPEGQARKAIEEYLGVMNQAKQEELAQMLGVDMYI